MNDADRPYVWLWTHCRALGMARKSDSGTFEHDIALFVAELHAKSEGQPASDGRGASRQDEKEDRGEPAVLPSEPADAKDAARWRFFAEHAQSFWNGRRLIDWMGFDGVMRYGSRDRAIDAARAIETTPAPIKGDPAEKSAGPSSGGSTSDLA